MSVSYSYPGVYIEEKDSGTRPIQGVTTTTAAFIGRAPDPAAFPLEPKPVNSFSAFRAAFGDRSAEPNHLANAVFGFFLNGGTRCYVVNLGAQGSLQAAVDALLPYDEIAMVAAPGFSDTESAGILIGSCERQGDRFAIVDAPGPARVDLDALVTVGQVAAPAVAGQDADETDAPAAPRAGLRAPASPRGFGALYFPWLVVRDCLATDRKEPVLIPPSGHIAGIYARTDVQRGIFKAPANEPVRGALGLSQHMTNAEQGKLNLASVNAIRFFTDQGIVVWGARTLAAPASNWRYVPVRRLLIFIEQSIIRSTSWVVFEPNDRPLWKSIRRDVHAFLVNLWRRGALMGATEEQAFFVKCDEETNPQENVDQGIVTIVIGVAPVKPAEFVIFEIGQMAGLPTAQEASGAA
ncbi:hypothetical protein FHS82_001514 [Pseudochelatococcus lubricantis]|uniref:Phage tail sheath family protein n=1 Tax=Pseudochelatococcus lubricantis TaxID=1538102 RepID=A0ABX0UXK7_9HYPH|nr:phage tail sheath subtilisin-like domain-containing protein [Pseudochelatococcus lubricantis]NIJ57678.1 hypothetical protein [Pseudochelatococcus lubricantis]